MPGVLTLEAPPVSSSLSSVGAGGTAARIRTRLSESLGPYYPLVVIVGIAALVGVFIFVIKMKRDR